MRAIGERRLADPVGALASHMGVAERRAVHPLRHEMAADAGVGPGAFGDDRRRIVRAAGAEVWNADSNVLGLRETRLRLLQPCDTALEILVGDVFQEPLADADGHLVGIESALD